MDATEFNDICNQFTKERLPALIRPQALKEINEHKQNHTKLVVISASPVNWVSPWCKQLNIDCIATRLEVKDERITGKISGRNCSGEEKVSCIKANYNLADFSKIYAYGDTSGDLPMLALSTHKFYRPFKKNHRLNHKKKQRSFNSFAFNFYKIQIVKRLFQLFILL